MNFLSINHLLLFALPSYLLIIPITKTISINFLEILLLLSILTNLVNIFISLRSKKNSFSRIWQYVILFKNILFPIFLIIIGFISSYFLSQSFVNWSNWSNGLGKLLDLIILPIVYGMTILTLLYFKKISPLSLFYSYFLSAVFISMLGLLYFVNGWLSFDNRLSIFYQSPNQLAIFLSPAILFGFFKLSTITNRFHKNIYTSFHITSFSKINYFIILFLLLLIFNLYLTFSLGAWLALLFSLTLLFLTKVFKNILTPSAWLILLVVTMSTIFIINIDILMFTFNYAPQTPSSSYDSRLTIYQVSQKILSANWLSGVGINNFQNTYLSYQKYFTAYPQWAIPHAHNNLITFWIEGGLLSIVGLFFLIFNILPLNKKTALSKKPSSLLYFSIFTYFLLHGIIDTSFWTADTAILFWITIVCLLSQIKK